MKIGFLSDTHGKDIKKFYLKDVDIVLSNGDFCKADLARKNWIDYTLEGKNIPKRKQKEAEKDVIESAKKFLNSFSKKPVYFIYGNVESNKYINFKLKKNIHNINEKIVKINGIKIVGIEHAKEKWWVDKYSSGKYDPNEKKVKKFLKKLCYVDILLSHAPPYGYLDVNDNPKTPKLRGKHHGSKLVLDYIKRKQPKYCLCGHIHEAKGRVKIGKTIVINGGLNGFEKIEITK